MDVKLFAVRTVYFHGQEPGEPRIYGERVLLFRADTVEEAWQLAEDEAKEYLTLNPSFRRIGRFEAFRLQEDPKDRNGVEVWSGLLASALEPDVFYRERYEEPIEGFIEE